MRRRSRAESIDALSAQLEAGLRSLRASLQSLDLRAKVRRLADLSGTLSELGVASLADHGVSQAGARERILAYFLMHVGVPIDSDELLIVGGIQEFARRVRELRVESGYRIVTGASPDPESGVDLRPDQYMLISRCPDAGAADRWRTANEIRRLEIGTRDKILKLFEVSLGEVLTTEQLAYVAGGRRDFGRRTRELRTELGYPIATQLTGRPDLSRGEYVLQSLDRIDAEHDRNIPFEVQSSVYRRDQNKCRSCGWTREAWVSDSPRFLELHHVLAHADGGGNSANNLVVLCSRCHDEVHAERLVAVQATAGIQFVPRASL